MPGVKFYGLPMFTTVQGSLQFGDASHTAEVADTVKDTKPREAEPSGDGCRNWHAE